MFKQRSPLIVMGVSSSEGLVMVGWGWAVASVRTSRPRDLNWATALLRSTGRQDGAIMEVDSYEL